MPDIESLEAISYCWMLPLSLCNPFASNISIPLNTQCYQKVCPWKYGSCKRTFGTLSNFWLNWKLIINRTKLLLIIKNSSLRHSISVVLYSSLNLFSIWEFTELCGAFLTFVPVNSESSVDHFFIKNITIYWIGSCDNHWYFISICGLLCGCYNCGCC